MLIQFQGRLRLMVILICVWQFAGCQKAEKEQSPVFTVRESGETGLDFNNTVTPTESFNVLNYMYFYNGAGAAGGDFNNDGKIDVFFASNQGENSLYLNEGKLKFKNVTHEARIPQDHGWSTGVSVVDINNDGLLDIYICKVGHYGPLKAHNQLLVCTGIKGGIPSYQDMAHEYGLDFSGFSTQAVFFDYDHDGDLDMFLLNHTVHQNGSFAPRSHFLGTYDALSGDRMFRNTGGHFTDVTPESKINSSAISYGLGLAVADLDMDGWPDLYVGNDFHENDYLYINKKDGTFEDQSDRRLMHTSKFSMGVDIADVSNDGFPEILSMDMLPEDPGVTMRSLGDDDYDVFYDKIASGYNYQYSHNNLQYNRRNGLFSETGFYSGIAATDWSWSPLWFDYDNDGKKDLFITNGIPKRLNDIDYVNFISGEEMQRAQETNRANNLSFIDKFPEIKIPNKLFHNQGKMAFQDQEHLIGNNLPSFSNGAVYADFDNDGDLDVVVNNMNGSAFLYENNSLKKGQVNYANVTLVGSKDNINAIGSKIILFSGKSIQTYEKFDVHGFMSSTEIPTLIGLEKVHIDSAVLVWPDNTFQKIKLFPSSKPFKFSYRANLGRFNYDQFKTFFKNSSPQVTDITTQSKLFYLHRENAFNEFDREPLMAHMLSTEGPGLAVADVDQNGLDDVFIGASKTFHSAVFMQASNGTFKALNQPALARDSMYEDVDALWADVNRDGHKDLIVASGGNEYYGTDEYMQPRVYLNDGKGNLRREPDAFSNLYLNASCIVEIDINQDGFPDLFIGARDIPWNYGAIPSSFLLLNDGHGRFIDVTDAYAPGLKHIGMVTSALWCDLNNDEKKDLVVACEWGPITAFMNNNGHFSLRSLTPRIKGWWNFLYAADLNQDGKVDIIAGNLGLNSRLQASIAEPVRLYYADFSGAGKSEPLITYCLKGKEIPYSSKAELEKHFPSLKKKYLLAADYSKASIEELFGSALITSAKKYTANYFANALLVNHGNFQFTIQSFPWEAQLSSYRTAIAFPQTASGKTSVLLGGNYYNNSVHSGRNDADFGTVVQGDPKGNISIVTLDGLVIKGQVRHIAPLTIGRKKACVLVRNNDSAIVLRFNARGK